MLFTVVLMTRVSAAPTEPSAGVTVVNASPALSVKPDAAAIFTTPVADAKATSWPISGDPAASRTIAERRTGPNEVRSVVLPTEA